MTREEAIIHLRWLYAHLQTSPAVSARDYRTAVKLAIEALQERPKGRREDSVSICLYECSCCGTGYLMPTIKHNFCPKCGADMKGE